MADDEEFERLNEAWQHRFDETVERLDRERQRQLHELAEKMHSMVTILCDAIRTTVRDPDVAMKMGHIVQAGLARLRAIDALPGPSAIPERN